MIFLADSSEDLEKVRAEMGVEVGQLLTPLTKRSNRSKGIFGIDNGAFSSFDANGFRSLLEREQENKEGCKFVAAPDVVGSAIRTLEAFDHWYPDLNGWPVALVAQDGQEDHPIPWHMIRAIFIGGSTDFKMGKHAIHIIRAAQIMGKWVHVGRVNTPDRWDYFEALGVDSCDGTGLSRYSHMRKSLLHRDDQPSIFNLRGSDGSKTS